MQCLGRLGFSLNSYLGMVICEDGKEQNLYQDKLKKIHDVIKTSFFSEAKNLNYFIYIYVGLS